MPILPPEIMLLLLNFAPLLTTRTWQYVPVLVAGSILTPQRRMVSSALRAMGLGRPQNRGAGAPLPHRPPQTGRGAAATPEAAMAYASTACPHPAKGTALRARTRQRDSPVRPRGGAPSSYRRWRIPALPTPEQQRPVACIPHALDEGDLSSALVKGQSYDDDDHTRAPDVLVQLHRRPCGPGVWQLHRSPDLPPARSPARGRPPGGDGSVGGQRA